MAEIITKTSSFDEVSRLKEIWSLAFGDEAAYIDRFFEYLYSPGATMTLRADGVLAAAIYTFPMRALVFPDRRRMSTSITYALGTDTAMLGYGYGMACMDASLDMQAENGYDLSAQVPANDTLFTQYNRRIGYCDAFYVREARLPAPSAGGGGLSLSPVTPIEYGLLREAQLSNVAHLEFDDMGLIYQKHLCADAEGGLYRIDGLAERGCAIIERLPDDVVFIKELLISDGSILNALAAVAAFYQGSSYVVRTPSDRGIPIGGEVRRFAMAKFFGKNAGTELKPEDNAYFGPAYD